MRRIWDAIGFVIVSMFVCYLLINMVKPYVPYMILAMAIVLVGKAVIRSRYW